jgi:hypothetical protein
MKNILDLFIVFSSLLLPFAWGFFLYTYLKKKKYSVAYGLLAISYIIFCVDLQLIGKPCGFYLFFSVLWVYFHYKFKKIENLLELNDINKKEESTNDSE